MVETILRLVVNGNSQVAAADRRWYPARVFVEVSTRKEKEIGERRAMQTPARRERKEDDSPRQMEKVRRSKTQRHAGQHADR